MAEPCAPSSSVSTARNRACARCTFAASLVEDLRRCRSWSSRTRGTCPISGRRSTSPRPSSPISSTQPKQYVRETVKRELGGRDLEWSIERREGEPSQVLREIAREIDASFIVVGRRGWSIAEELLLGSVSNRLVHRAEVRCCSSADRGPMRRPSSGRSAGRSACERSRPRRSLRPTARDPPIETAQAMAKRPARRTLGPDAIEQHEVADLRRRSSRRVRLASNASRSERYRVDPVGQPTPGTDRRHVGLVAHAVPNSRTCSPRAGRHRRGLSASSSVVSSARSRCVTTASGP